MPCLENGEMLSLQSVGKKFCRSLRRSLWYGTVDIARTFVGSRYDTHGLRQKEFWALEDISLRLKRGEALGIIGGNGAGKSTLLRLVSGIFSPDKGRIAVRGRVGTLIALGAGFHPYLSGRENILLNGAILGMSGREIADRTREIIEFADIGEFIEAPVSTYSSGMRVRLGFSIAIHSSPDILIIDEVLSVGDAHFMKKSYERMAALIQDQGVTAMVVSHNMGTIQRLCPRTLVLEKGKALFLGETDAAIACYHEHVLGKPPEPGHTPVGGLIHHRDCSMEIQAEEVRVLDEDGTPTDTLVSGRPAELIVRIRNGLAESVRIPVVSILVLNLRLDDLYTLWELPLGVSEQRGLVKEEATLSCKLPYLGLAPGRYKLIIKVGNQTEGVYDSAIVAAELKVERAKEMQGVHDSLLTDCKCVMPAQWRFLD
jgi:lipopolysaccharide transport system ATP-binding protein